MTARREAGSTLTTEVHLVDVKELATMLGIHHRSIWRLVAMAEAGHGNFPLPLRIGPKIIRWQVSAVLAYLASLAEESGR